ncbi:hypothetical protein B0H13DRAFT_2424097, partial [Mycena leptocephala]
LGIISSVGYDLLVVRSNAEVYVVALRCLPLERRLYIFEMGSLVADATVHSLTFPRLHLRLRRPSTLKMPPAPDVTQLSIPYPFSRREILSLGSHLSTTYHTPHVFTLHYGIFAVTWREIHWTNHKSFIIHFWPGHTNDDGNLIIGPGAFYEHPNRICQMAVGASGAYALLLIHEGDAYPGDEDYTLKTACNKSGVLGLNDLGGLNARKDGQLTYMTVEGLLSVSRTEEKNQKSAMNFMAAARRLQTAVGSDSYKHAQPRRNVPSSASFLFVREPAQAEQASLRRGSDSSTIR